MRKYYSPLRYPGGKDSIFNFVSHLFYENNLLGIEYAEAYAGGCGLALRLLFEGYVDHIYINDLDRSIYAFWYAVLNNCEELCNWIENIDISISNWEKYHKFQTNKNSIDLITLAKSTFFLNRTNVSGIIKGGVIGGKLQNGKYKLDARFNRYELINRIERIYKIRNRITLSNSDGIKFIKSVSRKTNDIFIYLDPPYYQKGAKLYMNYYNSDDHNKLASYVRCLNKTWLVSYDNNEFIKDLYSTNRKITYSLPQSTSNRIGKEILIFSNELKFQDSIKKLTSPIIA